MEQIQQTVGELLQEFKAQMKADPATADRLLLRRGSQIVQQYLQSNSLIDSEIVHQGHTIYFWLDNRQGIVDLMTRYLCQPLPLEEEAWARWEQIDYMAALKQYEATVERQKELLCWAKAYLPKGRLLWVMYDSTQALCWHALGKGRDWLQHFEEIIGTVTPLPENRSDRFQYFRTAAVMWTVRGETQQALQLIDRMHQLCDEDETWVERVDLKVKTHAYSITTWLPLKETQKILDIGKQATMLLKEYERTLSIPIEPSKQHELGIAYDNVGAALFFAGQYDLAIPLERHAIELAPLYEWTYLRLAAAVWTTTKNRTEALAILRKGAAVSLSGRLQLETLPEFAGIIQDPEFLEAAQSQSLR